MSRRSTPERLYQASRAATRQRLIGEREFPDRAEALVAAWEMHAADDGLERDGGGIQRTLRWSAEAEIAVSTGSRDGLARLIPVRLAAVSSAGGATEPRRIARAASSAG